MNVDELLAEIAKCFHELGCEDPHLEGTLREQARGACIRIMDKFSRFTPVDNLPDKWRLNRVFKEEDDLVAEVGIDSHDGVVTAARVRYAPGAS